jgi:hypothetical protein
MPVLIQHLNSPLVTFLGALYTRLPRFLRAKEPPTVCFRMDFVLSGLELKVDPLLQLGGSEENPIRVEIGSFEAHVFSEANSDLASFGRAMTERSAPATIKSMLSSTLALWDEESGRVSSSPL